MLRSTQAGGTVWENNLLIHLLVLHALAYHPDCRELVTTGAARAVACQRTDGGVPFVTDVDTWSAVTAGVALAGAHAPRHVQYRLADHLQALCRSTG